MTITKKDIMRNIMKKTNLDKRDSKNLVESLLNIIKNSLEEDKEVMISGFGCFKVRHKQSRIGRNPKTKVQYEISERNIIRFYPSRSFREELI